PPPRPRSRRLPPGPSRRSSRLQLRRPPRSRAPPSQLPTPPPTAPRQPEAKPFRAAASCLFTLPALNFRPASPLQLASPLPPALPLQPALPLRPALPLGPAAPLRLASPPARRPFGRCLRRPVRLTPPASRWPDASGRPAARAPGR